jgi:hypothetical protein
VPGVHRSSLGAAVNRQPLTRTAFAPRHSGRGPRDFANASVTRHCAFRAAAHEIP